MSYYRWIGIACIFLLLFFCLRVLFVTEGAGVSLFQR